MKKTEAISDRIVAGSLPHLEGDPLEAAWHAAAIACDCEEDAVSIIHTFHDGRVYYLAIPSRDLSSFHNAGTSLAAALPGMPGHAGDGMYIVQLGFRSIGVWKQGETLGAAISERKRLVSKAESLGIPVYDPDMTEWAEWWSSRHRGGSSANALLSYLTKAAAGVSILASAAWIGLSILTAFEIEASGILAEQTSKQAQTTLDRLKESSPRDAGPLFARFQDIAAAVSTAQGELMIYQIDKSEERIELRLPAFSNTEPLKAFGKTSTMQLEDGGRFGAMIITRPLPMAR